MQSKVGNVFLAVETAQRLDKDGIVNVVRPWIACFNDPIPIDFLQSVNPGLLKTELQRHVRPVQRKIMVINDPSPVFWILLAPSESVLV